MFEPFQNFLSHTSNKFQMTHALQASYLCYLFRKNLKEFLPGLSEEMISKNIEPAHFKRGILTVHVISPAWGQELNFKKEKILEFLRKKIAESKQINVHLNTIQIRVKSNIGNHRRPN